MAYIEQAIKLASVGKKGSRSLKSNLVEGVLIELKASDKKTFLDPVQKAALATALYFKGVDANEVRILESILNITKSEINPEGFVHKLVPSLEPDIKKMLFDLIKGKMLSQKEATEFGRFLLNIKKYPAERHDMARAVGAVWLRVRYASDEEYSGLYSAFIKMTKPSFIKKKEIDPYLVQLSEPFDGVERSPLLTPLIARFLIRRGFHVVSLCGESSGPKYGVTLKNIAKKLDAPFLTSNKSNDFGRSQWGAYIDHKDVNHSWEYWVQLRKRLIKRPFMATLEKFTHVMGAGIWIGSAFHEPFLKKMLSLGESIGFPVNIVIRKGREGSLTFSLSKPVVIHCSVKKKSGELYRNTFEFSMNDLDQEFMADGRSPISLEQNVSLIRYYIDFCEDSKRQKMEDLTDMHKKFIWQVRLTISGLEKVFNWVDQVMIQDK